MLSKKSTNDIYIYLILLILYIYLSSTSLILENSERFYFPFLLIAVFILILFKINSIAQDKKLIINQIIYGLLIFILFGWQILFSENQYFKYYITDIAVVIFILLNYVFLKISITSRNIKIIFKLIFILGVPLYFLALFTGAGFESKRFQAPPVFFIVLSLYFHYSSPNKKVFPRLFFIMLVLLFVLVSFRSGERTNLMLSLSAILVFLIGNRKRSRWSLYFFYGYMFLFFSIVVLSLDYILLETRFRGVIADDGDISLLSRLYEAQDAISFFFQSNNLIYYIFGHGHGALFEISKYIGSERNLTEGIYSHHIHIMPVLILFRYGIIGLFFYTWLAKMIFVDILQKAILLKKPVSNEEFIVIIAVLLYLLDSLFRNILINPFFAVFLSLYLTLRVATKQQQKGII